MNADRSRARVLLLVCAAPFLLVACRTIGAIAQAGGLDLFEVVASTFAPGYGQMVGKFVNVLEKSSAPTMAPPSGAPAPAGSPAPLPPIGGTTPPNSGGLPPLPPAGSPSPGSGGSLPPLPPLPGSAPPAGSYPPPQPYPPQPYPPQPYPPQPYPPQPYPSQPYPPPVAAAPAPQPPRLEIEFDILKELVIGDRTEILTIRNGDVIRDGDEKGEGADNYRVQFRTNTTCWVYVVQADTTGKLDRLFPRTLGSNENPVASNVDYSAPPDEGKWFYLDKNRGIEHVFLFASRERNAEMEAILAKIEREGPPAAQAPASSARVQVETVVMRGVGGERPGNKRVVATQGGSGVASYSPTSFYADNAKTSQLSLTRWFKHE